MAFSKLLTVLVLIHNTAGLLGAEERSSIVGGHDAPKGRWPGMVSISLVDDKGNKIGRCGGTILNKQWLMTAADCWERNPQPYWKRSWVSVGAYELDKEAKRYMEITFVIKNPKYQHPGSGDNIALVKLKKTINFSTHVAQVSLPSVDDTFGPSSECWIIGWGNTGTNTQLPYPQRLQELKIPIISNSECKASYPELTSDVLCAGYMDGEKDACEGDYGGPLMCRAAGGGFVQVGIMSYGSCGLQGRPGVYTQVSKHLRFINDYINSNEEASAEV